MGLIQQFFHHLYRTANSIVHLKVRVKIAQILWYRQQHISRRRILLNRVILMDTLWLKLRQHKFTDIGNNIFLQERSSSAAKFFEGFTPYSSFSLICRELQGLKPAPPAKIHRATKIDILTTPWPEQKRVILSAGGVSSKRFCDSLPEVTIIKVPSKKMFPLQ